MQTRQFDAFEQDSLIEGSSAAGQYLDELGMTDLAKLEERQFYEFFARFLETYAKTMNSHFEETKATLQ